MEETYPKTAVITHNIAAPYCGVTSMTG